MEKLGVIPDKIINLSCEDDMTLSRIKTILRENNKDMLATDLIIEAEKMLMEYSLNQKGVAEVFGSFMFNIDCTIKLQVDVYDNIHKMLAIRFSKSSPRIPPKIVILGPPGSGRSSQADLLSQ